ncbi:sigma-70 family RNA polymerase sigma factor [Cellulomonas triticagri]|uniref:Sigma-70 family RNA polymerase sigma factor n=1 Tax=Cellulomonas triticagri TaxID=2483352 RepID=A0A3M2JLS6_9CELL|nr:sigma-70 family RNA polymerase sigma factor [Cellulomonas triticagri]RMI14094.1 sigma-70 family RNA polymerase sigma factor [Cellulomonas triticagri]
MRPQGPDIPPPEFAAWYAAELPRTHRALTLAVGDAGIAEEAAAEAFARALARWDRVARMERPAAWVYTVALNEVRRSWRRAQLERRWVQRQREQQAPAPADPEDALWRAVADLPPRSRTAVALRYVADLTEAQVADVMNVSRGTVASTLSTARARLAAALGPTREDALR